MSIVSSPPENTSVIDRGSISTDIMDHSMDYIIEDKNTSITTIYVKTVPPCLTEEEEYTWLDIISQKDGVRALEMGDIWCVIHVGKMHLDDINDLLIFCIENYYIVQNYF